MNKHNIYKGLKDGTISINFNGHLESSNPLKAQIVKKDFIESFCEQYEYSLACAENYFKQAILG